MMTSSARGVCSVLPLLHTDFFLNETLASGNSGVSSLVLDELEVFEAQRSWTDGAHERSSARRLTRRDSIVRYPCQVIGRERESKAGNWER